MAKTVLTGLQATSNLHIGNYFGAILPMVKVSQDLATDDSMFMFVPDLHTFTVPVDYDGLWDLVLENVKVYVASGIDFHKPNIYLYRQSFIPAHSELTWILSCFSYFGEMQRMTQFKDKSTQHNQNVTVGLFSYPILMAADILLYGANYVPVGEDQQQHLELARNIAERMNNKFAEKFPEGLFVVPEVRSKQLEFINLDKALRIRSLSNPEKKMSKSVDDPKSKINLTDDPKEAAKKIMSAQTDSLAKIAWDWENQPGITNLLQMYSLLSGATIEETRNAWEGQTQYGNLKKHVAELIEQFLVDFQVKYNAVDDANLLVTLESGEAQVATIANQTLLRVQKAVGIRK